MPQTRLDLLLAESDPWSRLAGLRDYLEDGRASVARAVEARDATIRELYESGRGRSALARISGLTLSRVKQLTTGATR